MSSNLISHRRRRKFPAHTPRIKYLNWAIACYLFHLVSDEANQQSICHQLVTCSSILFVTRDIERKCCFHFEKQMTQVLQGHPSVLSAVCNYGGRREAFIAVLCPFYFMKKSFFGTDIIVSIAAWRLDSQCVCSSLVLFPSLKDTSHTVAASH